MTARWNASSVLFALGLGACQFEVVSNVSLPTVEDARSVIVGAESEDEVQVFALDLAGSREVELPVVSGPAESVVRTCARFFPEDLATLRVPAGRLAPTTGGYRIPVSRRGHSDFLREVYGNTDTLWMQGAFGAPLANFESEDLPPPNLCGVFEQGATLRLDSVEPVLKASPLSDDAIIWQSGGALYRASATEVQRLTALETSIAETGGAVVAMTGVAGGAVVASCTSTAVTIQRLAKDGTVSLRSVDGLDGCPDELSSFGDQLFALVRDTEVFVLDRNDPPWRRLGSFSRPIRWLGLQSGVNQRPFIATGPDEVVGLHIDMTSPVVFSFHGLTLRPDGETERRLAVPEAQSTSVQFSRPATRDGYVAVFVGSAATTFHFFLRDPSGEWQTVSEFKSQAVMGAAPTEDGFLVTGRYGFVVELRPYDEAGPVTCLDEAGIVQGSNATSLVPLGLDGFLLAGDSNRERQNPPPQEVSVIRLR